MEPAVSVVDVKTTPTTPLSGQKRAHTADHDYWAFTRRTITRIMYVRTERTIVLTVAWPCYKGLDLVCQIWTFYLRILVIGWYRGNVLVLDAPSRYGLLEIALFT